jgi:hypothetical protein
VFKKSRGVLGAILSGSRGRCWFERLLEQFDAAMRLGAEGRMRHTAATRELGTLTR